MASNQYNIVQKNYPGTTDCLQNRDSGPYEYYKKRQEWRNILQKTSVTFSLALNNAGMKVNHKDFDCINVEETLSKHGFSPAQILDYFLSVIFDRTQLLTNIPDTDKNAGFNKADGYFQQNYGGNLKSFMQKLDQEHKIKIGNHAVFDALSLVKLTSIEVVPKKRPKYIKFEASKKMAEFLNSGLYLFRFVKGYTHPWSLRNHTAPEILHIKSVLRTGKENGFIKNYSVRSAFVTVILNSERKVQINEPTADILRWVTKLGTTSTLRADWAKLEQVHQYSPPIGHSKFFDYTASRFVYIPIKTAKAIIENMNSGNNNPPPPPNQPPNRPSTNHSQQNRPTQQPDTPRPTRNNNNRPQNQHGQNKITNYYGVQAEIENGRASSTTTEIQRSILPLPDRGFADTPDWAHLTARFDHQAVDAEFRANVQLDTVDCFDPVKEKQVSMLQKSAEQQRLSAEKNATRNELSQNTSNSGKSNSGKSIPSSVSLSQRIPPSGDGPELNDQCLEYSSAEGSKNLELQQLEMIDVTAPEAPTVNTTKPPPETTTTGESEAPIVANLPKQAEILNKSKISELMNNSNESDLLNYSNVDQNPTINPTVSESTGPSNASDSQNKSNNASESYNTQFIDNLLAEMCNNYNNKLNNIY